jgi:hypothetical protein
MTVFFNDRWEILTVQNGSKIVIGWTKETGLVSPVGLNSWTFKTACDDNFDLKLKLTKVCGS